MKRILTVTLVSLFIIGIGAGASTAFATLLPPGTPDYSGASNEPGFFGAHGQNTTQDPFFASPKQNTNASGNTVTSGANTSGNTITPGTNTSGNTITAGADSGSSCSAGKVCIKNPTPYADLMAFIKGILNALVRLLMPVIAFMFIYTGVLFVTAGGSEEKLKTAKQALLGTVIGAAIVLGAWALAVAIAATIGSIGVPA
ncbi:MAG: hypothetical protein ACYC8S_00175 [Minisyncoccota bacterium]